MQAESNVIQVRGNKLGLNIAGALFTVMLVAASMVFVRQFSRYVPFVEWHAIALLASLCVILPVHELLHGLGARWFGKVSWSNIKFGVLWRALTPYCHQRVPVSLWAYRRISLLPFWVTGTGTIILLILFPTDWLALLASTSVGACVGDLWIVWKLRRFTDDNVLVHDSPTELGCDVYPGTSNQPTV